MAKEHQLTLYTGPNCALCEHAKEILYPLLTEYRLTLNQVDISTDLALKAQYGSSIPVVKLPTGVEKGWPFTSTQMRKILQVNLGVR